MCNIVEELERTKLGLVRYRKLDVSFKYLYGRSDDSLEELDGCPLFTARFCPVSNYKNVIALAAENGNVIVRNVSYPLSSPKSCGTYHLLKAHNNAVFDLCWAEGVARMVTASGDHSAALWDVSGPCVHHVMTFVGHTRSVRTVAASPTDCNIFATGSRDGSVMIWDCRGPRETTRLYPDNTISHCHAPNLVNSTKSKGVESITSVVFTDEYNIATCVAGQGTVCIWDIRRTYIGSKRRPGPKHLLHHPSGLSNKGFSCLSVSPCQLRLYASCIDSTIYCFNIGTFSQTPLSQYQGHLSSSFYLKHSVSPCGRYLISGSSDNNAYIWHESENKPIATLSGHLSEVTSAVWSPHVPFQLVTASEDGTYTIWTLDPLSVQSERSAVSFCTVTPTVKRIVKPKLACRFNCKRVIPPNGFLTYRESPSPVKSPIKQRAKKAKIELSPDLDFSPTAGLPNYVIDGSSPNVLSKSEKKPKEEDWLTRLRRETPPCIKGNSPTARKATTPRTSKAKGSLLKFFCNQSRRGKSSNGDSCKSLNGDGESQNHNSETNIDTLSLIRDNVNQL